MSDEAAKQLLELVTSLGHRMETFERKLDAIVGARGMLPIGEVAELAGVTVRQIHKLKARRAIPRGTVVGRKRLWTADEAQTIRAVCSRPR